MVGGPVAKHSENEREEADKPVPLIDNEQGQNDDHWYENLEVPLDDFYEEG